MSKKIITSERLEEFNKLFKKDVTYVILEVTDCLNWVVHKTLFWANSMQDFFQTIKVNFKSLC